MSVFLVPVDGSVYAHKALDYVAARVRQCPGPHAVHVLNVQMPLVSVNVKLLASADTLNAFYREEGQKIIDAALATLSATGVSATPHIGVGDAGQIIAEFSQRLLATEIVMGTHGRGPLSGAIMGSVAQKVVHLSTVPVVLIK